MSTSDVYLSEEFATFSVALAKVRSEKVAKKAELKKIYGQFEQELQELDKKAENLVKEWEKFKSEAEKNVGDG